MHMSHNILVDTGIWFAMFDPKDGHRGKIDEIKNVMEPANILIPWPSLYETLNTSFVKKCNEKFKKFLQSCRKNNPNAITYIDDSKYRGSGFEQCFKQCFKKERPMSLVDIIIRSMLVDTNLRIHGLATIDKGLRKSCPNTIELIPYQL